MVCGGLSYSHTLLLVILLIAWRTALGHIIKLSDHLYLYRRVCVCVCAYPSKRIHFAVCRPIGTKFGTHMQIHLEKVVGKIKICPVSRRGNLGGFRGSEIENVLNLPNGWTD